MITKQIKLDDMKIEKIELASQDNVNAREKYIDKVLDVLGFPESLVTDESIVADFCEFCSCDENKEKELSAKFDMRIRAGTLIYEIADKMEHREKYGKRDYTIEPSTKWEEIKDKWDDFVFWTQIWRLRDVKTYLKNLIFRRKHIIKTKLPRGQWWDTDSRMLYGMMNLLMEFIEKENGENGLEFIDWDSDPIHKHIKEEIIAIRDWWLNYQNRLNEIDKTLTNWSDETFFDKNNLMEELSAPETAKSKSLHNKLHQMEEKLEIEEEEMLIRLIKIRKHLWT